MIDTRFYAALGPLPVSDIASAAGLDPPARGGERMLVSVAAAASATAADLTFLEEADPKLELLAGACFAAEGVAAGLEGGATIIVTEYPRAAFAAAAARLVGLRDFSPGPAIHPGARIGDGAVLGAGVVVGEGASIGSGARIGPNSVIGPGVQLGWRTSVGANVSIRCALIGEDVTILSGAVIGESGFGLAVGPSGAVLTPHFGRVIIQSGVSIGANTTVDRGLFDDTVIGEGAHIDNLCHIAHNALIGVRAVMAAFAGVSGSAEVGDGAMFGGRVGLADHVKVGKGARIAAGAAVLQDVAAGETVAGYPAKAIRAWMREGAWLAREAQRRPTRGDKAS